MREMADPQQQATLWQTTAILADMRYDQELILPLMRKAMTMVKLEDFPSYTKGALRERRETIVDLGTRVLGAPDAGTRATLESINDLDCLRRMTNRILDVKTWQELLADYTRGALN